MFTAAVALAIALALIMTPLGIAKIINHPMASATADRLGLSLKQSRAIGITEILGSAGLLIGLGWAPIGIAAATGDILLLIGAVATHIKVRDPIYLPAFPLVLAVMSAAFLILRIRTA